MWSHQYLPTVMPYCFETSLKCVLNMLLHIQLVDECSDHYSQYRPFFGHIQLAVDRTKNKYSLCSVTL